MLFLELFLTILTAARPRIAGIANLTIPGAIPVTSAEPVTRDFVLTPAVVEVDEVVVAVGLDAIRRDAVPYGPSHWHCEASLCVCSSLGTRSSTRSLVRGNMVI